MMNVHPSGYYAWQRQPLSARAQEDQRLLGQIKQCWLESGGIYGYRKIRDDLRELGETCGKHRVARLMRHEDLRSQTGYHRRPSHYGGRLTVVAPNHLERQFDVTEPNEVWVTDITYICTHEGWLYLAAVLDLFSRQVVGWSMGPRIDRDLAISALLMAVWRRCGGDVQNRKCWLIPIRVASSAVTTGRIFTATPAQAKYESAWQLP